MFTSWLVAGALQASQVLSQGTVSRSVRVMDFTALSTSTTVVFRYAPPLAGAAGEADILPEKTQIKIHAAFTNLAPASRLGPQYLTYVLWSVTPQGRFTNLGEVELLGSDGQLNTKIRSRRFGLIVTAEAYLAVSQPSKMVAFEADVAPESPRVPVSQTRCELLSVPVGAESVAPAAAKGPAGPLVLEEARRAIAVARQAGAQEYAPDTLAIAEKLLQLAQDQQAQGVRRKDVDDAGSEAVFIAEDARVLAVTRQKRARQARTDADPSP